MHLFLFLPLAVCFIMTEDGDTYMFVQYDGVDLYCTELLYSSSVLLVRTAKIIPGTTILFFYFNYMFILTLMSKYLYN